MHFSYCEFRKNICLHQLYIIHGTRFLLCNSWSFCVLFTVELDDYLKQSALIYTSLQAVQHKAKAKKLSQN